MGAFLYWTPDINPAILAAYNQQLAAYNAQVQAAATASEEGVLAGAAPSVGPPPAPAPLPNSNILYFDGTLEEKHPIGNDITEHPVEQGPDITDHIRPTVDRVMLRCFVSNEPIYPLQDVKAQLKRDATVVWGAQSGSVRAITKTYPTAPVTPGISAALNAVVNALSTGQGQSFGSTNQSVTFNVLQFDNVFDNVQEVNDTLRFLRDQGIQVEVVTSVRTYTSMVVEKAELTRDRASGNGGWFTIELKQINVVSTQTVAAPTEISVTPKIDKGAKGAKPVTPAQNISMGAKTTNAAKLTDAGTGAGH